MEQAVYEYLISTSIFRIAALVVGVYCIYMGYRLLLAGGVSETSTDIEATVKNYNLTVKNAAPGTCFAVFGAVIVVTVLLQDDSSLSMRELNPSTGLERSYDLRGQTEQSDLSNAFPAFDQATVSIDGSRQSLQNLEVQLSEPDLTLGEARRYFIDLAEIYISRRRYTEAETYLRLAVQINSNDLEAIGLLAEVLLELGDIQETKKAIRSIIRSSSSHDDEGE